MKEKTLAEKAQTAKKYSEMDKPDNIDQQTWDDILLMADCTIQHVMGVEWKQRFPKF